jgi:pre-60S factor REI1
MGSVTENAPPLSGLPEEMRFTCLSCSIAFISAEEQSPSFTLPYLLDVQKTNLLGIHYRSDHHKYNMKRRVASLPPVSLAIFDQKVAERKPETKVTKPPKGPSPEKDINQIIDQKIAAASPRLSPLHCLFCPHASPSLDDNLTHMSASHSFFIPDADYLVDLTGLVLYLGEKIAVGNFCIYCNSKSREFRTLDAVWKHMADKSHCKIAYESDDDRLEVSDFYDFTSSYPQAEGKEKRRKMGSEDEEADEWEDMDDGGLDSADEVVEESVAGDDEEDADLANVPVTYDNSHQELVLPSGSRIGHRSRRRYHPRSTLRSPTSEPVDPNIGVGLVRRLLADRNSALVPRKGGFGAFGQGTDVVKARNRGEAREAGRHVREFRDQKRREDFKTRVGFINNSQKHYRDALCTSYIRSLQCHLLTILYRNVSVQ